MCLEMNWFVQTPWHRPNTEVARSLRVMGSCTRAKRKGYERFHTSKDVSRPSFSIYGRYTTNKKISVENEPTRRRFLREPGEDINSTGSVTEERLYPGVSSFSHASSCWLVINSWQTFYMVKRWKSVYMLYQKAHHVIACLLSKKLKTSTLTENCGYHLYFSLRSPPPRLPLGIPTMTAIIEKQKARGGRWEEEKGESFSYSRPPSRRAPRAFFFFFPGLPTTQKRA